MYMRGGICGCHPRDNIALDFAAKQKLSNDLYTEQMQIRERHISWFADILKEYNLPKVILGKSYKPETNLQLVARQSVSIMNYKIKK